MRSKWNELVAYGMAERLLEDLGMRTLPIDAFVIAARKRIEVKAARLRGCAGCLFRSGEKYGILYSDELRNEGFERFTVSHELGHYFLPGHPEHVFAGGASIHRSHSGFVSTDSFEQQADHFAAGLLMPEKLFRAALRAEAAVGFPAVERLAALCKTSLVATAIRFAEFADDAVAIVLSKGDRVEWCAMSTVLKDLRGVAWLKKGALVPGASATAAFNRDAAKVAVADRAEGASLLSLWLDGAPDVEMMEDVVGLGRYERTLTVLFTEEVLGEDDDTEGVDD